MDEALCQTSGTFAPGLQTAPSKSAPRAGGSSKKIGAGRQNSESQYLGNIRGVRSNPCSREDGRGRPSLHRQILLYFVPSFLGAFLYRFGAFFHALAGIFASGFGSVGGFVGGLLCAFAGVLGGYFGGV